jgi:hypothetical protein
MEIRDTEKLRDEIADLRDKLRDGKISNSVARSIILAARFELESLKAEMEAVRLGSSFGPVSYHSEHRQSDGKPKLKRVA